jgi:putative ABC transport system permease protein
MPDPSTPANHAALRAGPSTPANHAALRAGPSTPANDAALRAGPSTPANDAALRAGWAREVRTRLSALRLPPTREADIVDELSQHLDDRWRELVAGGALPDEATRLTLAEFSDGNLLARYIATLRLAHQPSSIAPGVPGGHVLGDLLRDLRYARRTLAAKPGFTTVAILSLALGIGANTAIFGLWNGVLHASLPAVHDPEQLVMLSNPDESGSWTGRTQGTRAWLTYGEFEQLRDHAGSFSAVMASQSSLSTWQVRFDGGGWEEATGRFVSGGFFQVLGVGPAIGRLFTAADDRTDTPYAVISDNYWRRRFGGRADVLGKTLTIRNAALTIIGVAPPGFIGETSGQRPDLWLPLRTQPSVLPGNDRLHDTPPEKAMWLHVFGRLRPDVTQAQAEAQANAVFRAGLESFYGVTASTERRREFLDQRLEVRPARRGASRTRREFAQSLTTLLAAVGVLLLIACANLANLLLARGAARTPEMALRLSLGASRGRLVRQLVTESLALAAIGGIAAIAVADLLHAALVRMLAESDPRFHISFSADPLVLAFLFAATVAAALLFGMLPAWQVTRSDAGASLKQQSRGAIGSFGRLRSGRFLVAVQMALSLPLLVGAGLLARTVYNLQRADLGFPAERLLLVRVNLREAGYEGARRDRLLRELVGEIRRIPGVQATSFSQLGVFTGGESSATIEVEGYAPKRDDDRESALDVIGPGYFSTLGVPMRLGREILESDSGNAATVCVINEAFAQRFFDQRNPIGMRITLVNDADRTSYRVVGVANNARTQSLRGDVAPRFYVPAKQPPSSTNSPTLLIRTATETGLVLAAARKAIQGVDAAVPIISAASIEEEMVPLTAQDRTTAQLAVVFGCIALTLAAIGLYGVLSYGVARRTGEIAIRIALGAQPGRVVSMILGETVAVVSAGLVLGAGLAYAAARLINSRLYGVAPQDPLTLALATALLLSVALVAAYVPALRASKLDPMVALRQQ